MYHSPHESPCTYVADLPPSVMYSLYEILDTQDSWKHLAARLGFSLMAIERFRRQGSTSSESSPTRILLLNWMNQRPTVVELYGALLQENMISASEVLQNYVPPDVVPRVQQPPAYHPSMVSSYGRQPPPPHYGLANDIPMPTPPTGGNMEFRHGGHIDRQENYHLPQTYRANDYFPYQNQGTRQNRSVPLETTTKRGIDINYDFTPKSESRDENMNSVSNIKPKRCQEQNQIDSPQQPPPTTSHVDTTPPSLDPRDRVVKSKTMLAALIFTYHDVKDGTDNFSEKNILGEGGFGIVYRAVLKSTVCAVKILKEFGRQEDENESIESNLTEIASLFIYRHSNIITLIGYSAYGPKTCLVYEFMANGSLNNRLRCKGGTPPLTWQQRHRIMMGAARGLQYLHTAQAKPLIHGDIKSANILLDQRMEAKLSDFGQARQATSSANTGQFTHVTKKDLKECPIYATRAYLPMDFFLDCKLSIWTDTFSFGVVIFEVCTGQKALDPNQGPQDSFLRDYIRDRYEANGLEILVKEMDRNAPNWPTHMFMAMLKVGIDCTEKRKKARPEMKKVLSTLDSLVGEMQIEGQRLPPVGASDQNDLSMHHSCPPMSHRFHYNSGQHQDFQVNLQPPSLSPPSSMEGGKSYQTLSTMTRPSDGEDSRYLDYNPEKLTHSERISEEGRLEAGMRGLQIGPQSMPGSSLSVDSHTQCTSVPLALQRMYDQRSYNSTVSGSPLEGNLSSDQLGNPSTGPDTYGQSVSESGSQSSAAPSVITSLEHHVELVRSKKKKKKDFPFQTAMEESNPKTEESASQHVEGAGYDIVSEIWSPQSSSQTLADEAAPGQQERLYERDTPAPGQQERPCQSDTPAPGLQERPCQSDTPTPGLQERPYESDTPTPGQQERLYQRDTPAPDQKERPYHSDTPTPGQQRPYQSDTPAPDQQERLHQSDPPANDLQQRLYQRETPAPGLQERPYESETPAPGLQERPYESETPAPGLQERPYESETPAPGLQERPYQNDTPTPGRQERPYQSETPAPGQFLQLPVYNQMTGLGSHQQVQESRSFEPPDSESIHSSDLYQGFPNTEVTNQNTQSFLPTSHEMSRGEAAGSSGLSIPEDMLRIQRGLGLQTRRQLLEGQEQKE